MSVKESLEIGRGRHSLDRSIWYSGWLMTLLATGDETQGQFAVIEAVGRRGNVPPPHIHHWCEETFYVLEGQMTVSIGVDKVRLTPGTMVTIPRHTVHSFVIDSDQLRNLTLFTPAGEEKWFKEFSVPAPSMTLPPPPEIPYSEIDRMMAAAPKFGIEFVLPKTG